MHCSNNALADTFGADISICSRLLVHDLVFVVNYLGIGFGDLHVMALMECSWLSVSSDSPIAVTNSVSAVQKPAETNIVMCYADHSVC